MCLSVAEPPIVVVWNSLVKCWSHAIGCVDLAIHKLRCLLWKSSRFFTVFVCLFISSLSCWLIRFLIFRKSLSKAFVYCILFFTNPHPTVGTGHRTGTCCSCIRWNKGSDWAAFHCLHVIVFSTPASFTIHTNLLLHIYITTCKKKKGYIKTLMFTLEQQSYKIVFQFLQ